MDKKIKILGIAGSLRKASYNKGLLRVAAELLPAGVVMEVFDLQGIPVFSQDNESPLPSIVVDFKAKIRAADAILLATPEYNYSIPGVLKNALDWASRPNGDNAWDGKPVAMMGASPSALGTARAQYHLRQVFVTLNMPALNKPEVMVAAAHEKFDAEGNLMDDKTRKRIEALLKALVEAVS